MQLQSIGKQSNQRAQASKPSRKHCQAIQTREHRQKKAQASNATIEHRHAMQLQSIGKQSNQRAQASKPSRKHCQAIQTREHRQKKAQASNATIEHRQAMQLQSIGKQSNQRAQASNQTREHCQAMNYADVFYFSGCFGDIGSCFATGTDARDLPQRWTACH